MPLVLTASLITNDDEAFYVFGLLTPSGSYPTGGDTLSFLNAVLPIGQSLPVNSPCVSAQIEGTTGDQYGFIRGTTLANGKVKINTASNTELGAGAYAARFTGDLNIQGFFVFAKLL